MERAIPKVERCSGAAGRRTYYNGDRPYSLLPSALKPNQREGSKKNKRLMVLEWKAGPSFDCGIAKVWLLMRLATRTAAISAEGSVVVQATARGESD